MPKCGGWTYSEQRGTPGHCSVAQLWDSKGKSLARFDSTKQPSLATSRARLTAAAPDLLEVCKELEESSEYWSEYDVPVGIVEKLKKAIAKAGYSDRSRETIG